MTANDDPFEELLLRLEPQAASAAERYCRLRGKLIRFFQWKRCRDAESLADEAIGRLLTKIYEGEQIDKPGGYLYGIAQNVLREDMRRTARLVQIEDEGEMAHGDSRIVADDDPFVECAKLCSARLPEDKRRLLEQYYSDEGSRAELARGMGLSLAALRTKIHRLKAELKQCYQDCIRGPR